MISQTALGGGSDLHLKPNAMPRVRINGRLVPFRSGVPITADQMYELARSAMDEKVWQDFLRIKEVDFAYLTDTKLRVRANVFMQRGMVSMVMRLISTDPPNFEDLHLPSVLATLAENQRGLVLVTGPTGSGKTSTLAAMVDHVNRSRPCHIVTIEDPIEVMHEDKLAIVNQREIGFDTGSFASAMRAAMRQDPDVILVGEMRDLETVTAALQAAETGHLVLSTLHTIDAVETITRIVDFFPPHQQQQVRISLAGVIRGVVCQRLIPTPDGKGRVPAVEVMVANGRVQQCIVEYGRTSDLNQIIAEGEFYGMTTFDQSLERLFSEGLISVDDALESATSAHDLRLSLTRKGLVNS
ncbi:MAG: type IV pilus twitching motility protein PilT [Acidimicrobiaceae bacterium]|nr:type IV pilus twitching motility protein PilT [Acidimicrobiaceae bacterium]